MAERHFNRRTGQIKLLAASKTQAVDTLRAAIAAGQLYFAENYVREALAKIQALDDPRLEWHFIGTVQSNKCRDLARHFQWVQSVDRLKIARRLSALRPAHLPPLNLCLQVNIGHEASKSGVAPDALPSLAEACAALPNIRLRGLMTMPPKVMDFAKQRTPFSELRRLFEDLQSRYPTLDTLSMGTTDDMEAAIAEGTAMLRIGTAIFGARAN